MNEKYLKDLYSWISSQDPTYKSDVSYGSFVSKMEDESYANKMYDWISSMDKTYANDISRDAFISKVKKKDIADVDLSSAKSSSVYTSKTKEKPSSNIYTGYPGKPGKQYKFENGAWYEDVTPLQKDLDSIKYQKKSIGGAIVDMPNQAKSKEQKPVYKPITDVGRVSALNKHFGKEGSTSPQEKIYFGYPGKEKNEYRVKNGTWQRRQPGKTEWTTVTNEGSISSLNKQFKQDVAPMSSSQKASVANNVQRELDLEKNINQTVTPDLIAQETFASKWMGVISSDQDVADKLKKSFPSFSFTPVGGMSDRLLVKAPNGATTYIALDNWTDEGDKEEAELLKTFIRVNSKEDINKSAKKLDTIQSQRDKEIDVATNKLSAENLLNRNQQFLENPLSIYDPNKELNQLMTQFQAGKNTREKIIQKYEAPLKKAEQEYVKAKAEQFRDVYEMTRINKDIDPKNAYASIRRDDRDIKIVGDYYNQVQKSAVDFKNNQQQAQARINELSQKVSSNEMTIEEYNKAIELENEKLAADAKLIADQMKVVTTAQKGMDKSVGMNYIIEESRGSFGGGLSNKFVKGLTSIPRMLSFGDMSKEDQNALVAAITGGDTTTEYVESAKRGDLAKSMFSLAESMGVMAASGALGLGGAGALARYAGFYGMSYYEMKDQLDEATWKNPKTGEIESIPETDKVLMSAGYGVLSAVLENFGIDLALQKTAFGRNLSNTIMKRVFADLPGDATENQIKSAIMADTKKFLAEKGIQSAIGAGAEFLTETSQALTQVGMEEVYDNFISNKDFSKNKGFWDVLSDAAYEGYLGALGGGVMSTINNAPQALQRGLNSVYSKEEIALLINSAKVNGINSAVVNDVKAGLLTGQITKEQGRAIINSFDKIQSVTRSMPSNLTEDQEVESLELMLEREELTKEMEGKDPNLVVNQKARIDEINNRLKEIGSDAVQKPSTTEVLSRESETIGETGSEREGMGQKVEGDAIAQESVQTANQEEVNQYITDMSSEARIGGVLNPIMERMTNAEYINDNEIDNAIEAILNEADNIDKSDYSPETKKAISEKLLNIAEKLDNYEFRTKTETIATTKAGPATSARQASESVQKIRAEKYFDGSPATVNGQEVTLRDNKGRVEAQMPNGEVVVIDTPTMEIAEDGFEFDDNDRLIGLNVTDRLGNKIRFTGDQALDLAIRHRENQLGVVEQAEFETVYQEVERKYIKESPVTEKTQVVEQTTTPTTEATTQAEPVIAEETIVTEEQPQTPDTQEEADLESMLEENGLGVTEQEFDQQELDDLESFLSDEGFGVEPTTETPRTQRERVDSELPTGVSVRTQRGAQASQKASKLKAIADKAYSAVKSILPDLKIVIHENTESYVAESTSKIGKAEYNPRTRTIHIDGSKADRTTIPHEVFHAVFMHAVRTDERAAEAAISLMKSIRASLDSNSELAKAIDDFAKRYERFGIGIMEEERLAQIIGMLAGEYKKLNEFSKNKIIEFFKQLAKRFGINLGSEFGKSDQSVIALMNTLSEKIAKGEQISQEEAQALDKSRKIARGTAASTRLQADFSDAVSKLTFTYDKNTQRFKKLEEQGYITNDKTLADFAGKYMLLHQPDAAFSGMIYKDGQLLVEGKGGVFYPIKFHDDGYFWASTSKTAKKMAEDLNKVLEQNNGVIYMALTSAPSDKLMSSTTMANAILDFFSSKAFDKNFKISPAQLKSALRKAAADVKVINNKNVGLGIKSPASLSIDELKSEIRKALDPDNSTFGDRKNFAEELIRLMADQIKSDPKAQEQFGKLFSEGIQNKYFKGVTKTGKVKISTANMVQAISEMFTEPLLKEGVNREKGGQVYAVIELNGKVKDVDSDKHESYPKAIQSDSDAKVKIHVLQDRQNWNEVFEDPQTNELVSKDRELKIYPTTGVSTQGLKVSDNVSSVRNQVDSEIDKITQMALEKGYSYPVIKQALLKRGYTEDQINNAFAVKPAIKQVTKTEGLTTDKDVRPGYDAALEALNETEQDREEWRKEHKVSQRAKRVPAVEKAVKQYYNEEITQDEYLAVVAKEQPIKPLKEVPYMPTLEDVVNSLDTNKVATGIIGLTKNIKDGELVATRLDIPAYEQYDTWVVSIHDGNKEGKSLAYGQTAVLKNVTFRTSPRASIKIAMGGEKQTTARMFGEWVNEDPQSVKQKAEKLINDPQWTQVGVNLFRYSWFYDKATGMPLSAAEELIQVGPLVLAKNVTRVSPTDQMFETKSAKGNAIRFQLPQLTEIDRIVDIARQNGYSDDSIKKVLSKRGFTTQEINDALKVTSALNTVMPKEFGNVEGGANMGKALFDDVMGKLKSFIANNPDASKAEVRQEGMRLLKDHQIFKDQHSYIQQELILAMDKAIGIKAGKTIQNEINEIRKSLKNKKIGANDLKRMQAKLREFIRKSLPKSDTYSQGQINRLLKIVNDATITNLEAQVDLVLDEIQTQREKMKQAVIKNIVTLVSKKAKAAMTATGKRRSGGLDAEGQAFFAAAKPIIRAAAENDVEAMLDIMNELSDTNAIDEVVQKEIDGEKLTTKEQELLNKVLAFDTFADIQEMSLEDVSELYEGLKDVRKESISRLKSRRLEVAQENNQLRKEVADQIRERYKALYNEDGSLKDGNELADDEKEIWESFRKGKVLEGLRKWISTYDFRTITGIKSFFVNRLTHIGTLTTILDKGGKFLYDNIYRPINRMDEAEKKGYQDQMKKLDQIANSISGITKGYDQIVQMLGETQRRIKLTNGKSMLLTADQMLRIYALSKNAIQKQKLYDMGFGKDQIDDIKSIVGPEPIEFADKLVEYLSGEYFESVNDVYSYVNNVNLGYIENYFPTTTLATKVNAKILEDGNFNGIFNAETAPAFKERVDQKSPIDLSKTDFVTAVSNHFQSMEKYKAYAVGVKRLNALFNSPDFNTLLEQTRAKKALKNAVNYAINPSYGMASTPDITTKLFTKFTGFALAFKVAQIPKQATSYVNSYENYQFRKGKNTPGLDFLMYTIDTAYVLATLPKQLKTAYKNSANFRDRIAKGFEGDVYGLESGSRAFKPVNKRNTWFGRLARRTMNAASAPTMIGDVLGVMGYMVNYHRDLKNGMSEAEALEKFNDYNATLQSRRNADKIPLQMSQTEMSRAFTMFASTAWLQLNKVTTAMTRMMNDIMVNKKMPSNTDIRAFALNLGIANSLFVIVSNLPKYWYGDDEDKEAVKQAALEALLGLNLIYQIPIIGDGIEEIAAYVKGERYKGASVVNPFSGVFRKIKKAYENLDDKDGTKFKVAQPMIELVLGTQLDPFIGVYNAINAKATGEDVDPNDIYDMIGVAPSYRPTEGGHKFNPNNVAKEYGYKNKGEMERQDPELYEKLFGEGGKFYEEDQAKLRENRIARITNRAEEDLKYGNITQAEFDAIVKEAEDNDGYSEGSTERGESKSQSTGMKVRF